MLNENDLASILWPLNAVFGYSTTSFTVVLARGLLLLGVPAVILLLASLSERTLFLQGDGVGLVEHTGFLCFFAVHILIVVLLPRTLSRCASVFTRLPATIDLTGSEAPTMEAWIAKELSAVRDLFLRSKTARAVKSAFVFVGVGAVVYNAANTMRPHLVYGHDVWDSIDHPFGYVVARVYLALTWGVILPILLHGLLMYCVVIYATYAKLGRTGLRGVVQVRPLSPDRAGGLGHIHAAMMAVVVNVLPLFVFTVSLVYVHGLTAPVTFGTVGLVLVLCCLYFLPLSSVHGVMQERKCAVLSAIETCFNRVDDEFRAALREKPGKGEAVPNEMLDTMRRLDEVYQRAAKMPVWPFDSSSLSRFVMVVLLPVLFTVFAAVLRKLV